MDRQFAEHWATGHCDPLARRIDQVANRFDGQAHGQVLGALEGHDQHVVVTNRAAVAGDLITPRHQGAAFGEGVLRVHQGVAEIVFDHGSSKYARYASTGIRAAWRGHMTFDQVQSPST
ncbi:hypothetical protein D9M72_559270 [compost metagenome]